MLIDEANEFGKTVCVCLTQFVSRPLICHVLLLVSSRAIADLSDARGEHTHEQANATHGGEIV
jgi:hypothetical protein